MHTAFPILLLAVHTLVQPPQPLTVRVTPDESYALDAALDRARRARQQQPGLPVIIELGDGRYQLAGPIHLTGDDSGLTLRAAPGARPVLSAGMRLTGWTRDARNPAEWSAVVLDPFRTFHQLFVNDQRAQRARTPNDGFFRAAGPLGDKSPITLPFAPGDIKPEWAAFSDARLVMLQKWTDVHLPIVDVDADAHSATLPGGPRPFWMDEPDARYWIENVPEALDAPGEWYHDRAASVVRYIPPEGLDPNTALVVAPRQTVILRIEGTPERPVADVRITGLTFADTDHDMPAQGLVSPQAAVPIRGSVRVTHATNLVIEDCTLRNLGGYAIDLGRGVQGARIVGNTITSIGAGGVRIGEPDDRSPLPPDECRDNHVTDNSITKLGRIFAPACGVIIFQSSHNRVAHNHIADLFYTGISVGWTWGYTESPCHHNTIEFNLVEQVGQKRLSDMGGIYTLGPQPGTVVRHNIFRDVQSYRYGGWGLYTDEGSTGILIEHNIATRCTDAGFHQHYGRDNTVRHNLLAFNERHAVMRTRDEPHRSFEFTGNVIIQDSGTLLGSNWNGGTDRFTSDSNLWFDTRIELDDPKYTFGPANWTDWRTRGHDTHSIIADPMLVDPSRPERGLKPGSPAFALGYTQIDVSAVGPRPKAARSDPIRDPAGAEAERR